MEVCEAGGQRIRVFWVVGLVHAACWLPLYTDTLVEWGSQQKTITHEVTGPSCHVKSCHVRLLSSDGPSGHQQFLLMDHLISSTE